VNISRFIGKPMVVLTLEKQKHNVYHLDTLLREIRAEYPNMRL